MQQFIAENPGVAMTIGGVLSSGLIAAVVLCWSLIREGGSKTERRFTNAIEKLEQALERAIDRMTNTIDSMDSRHNIMSTDMYNKMNEIDRRLTALRGEHDNRGDHCPGAMALNKLLADGTLDRRHV